MAIIKHISIKNSSYTAALESSRLLIFAHKDSFVLHGVDLSLELKHSCSP